MHKSKQTFLGTATIAVATAFVIAGSSAAFAYKGELLASSAAITMRNAMDIAHKVRPGKIIESELEREPGGSGLRYSFIIQRGVKKYEVGIDAKDGKVLENKVEGRNPD